MRGAAAIAVSLALVAALLFWATDGLRAVTAEGARRIEIARAPRDLPPADLFDTRGRAVTLPEPSVLLVEFVYTRCTQLCYRMSAEFAQLARWLREEGLEERVGLLSISFDPRDSLEDLAEFGARFGADGERWRFARIDDPAQLEAWLERFGVVRVPDPVGGWQHNAAVHALDRGGRLARVFDFDDRDGLRAWLAGAAS